MEMRMCGHVADDAGDLADVLVLHFENLADTVRAVEMPPGSRLVDNDAVRCVECGGGVAGYKGESENAEKGRVCHGVVMFLYPFRPVLDHDVGAKALYPGHLFYLRIVIDHRDAEGFGRKDGGQLGIVEIDVVIDAIDAVGIDVEPV